MVVVFADNWLALAQHFSTCGRWCRGCVGFVGQCAGQGIAESE
jgi:hypothetical protein